MARRTKVKLGGTYSTQQALNSKPGRCCILSWGVPFRNILGSHVSSKPYAVSGSGSWKVRGPSRRATTWRVGGNSCFARAVSILNAKPHPPRPSTLNPSALNHESQTLKAPSTLNLKTFPPQTMNPQALKPEGRIR